MPRRSRNLAFIYAVCTYSLLPVVSMPFDQSSIAPVSLVSRLRHKGTFVAYYSFLRLSRFPSAALARRSFSASQYQTLLCGCYSQAWNGRCASIRFPNKNGQALTSHNQSTPCIAHTCQRTLLLLALWCYLEDLGVFGEPMCMPNGRGLTLQ